MLDAVAVHMAVERSAPLPRTRDPSGESDEPFEASLPGKARRHTLRHDCMWEKDALIGQPALRILASDGAISSCPKANFSRTDTGHDDWADYNQAHEGEPFLLMTDAMLAQAFIGASPTSGWSRKK